ncbi:MAG: BatA and WFA domain-containing protein [Planctomycetota bacterium]|nr:BatA and WFA domain-containing protein [Planctomycetota bacterium]
MTFLAATSFALAGLIPLIVLMYILKLKRRPAVVPSTYLWRKTIEDMRVNAPFQRLRKSLLLLLQILTVALLVFALARPILPLKATQGRALILLVDVSASMQATDVDPTRFELARAVALEIVDEMAPGDQMMVISFGARARIACPMTSDRSALRGALSLLQCEDTPTNAREAMMIALSVAKAQKAPPDIVFLSDGNIPDIADMDIRDELSISYMIVGLGMRNAGITTLDARRRQDAARDFDIFAAVKNFDALPMDVPVELFVNDKLADARVVSIQPGAQESLVFRKPGLQEGIVEVRLGLTDDLATDNHAWSVLRKEEPLKLLVVGDDSEFLQKALNLHEHVKVFTMNAADFLAGEQAGSLNLDDYDVVVMDNVSPVLPVAGTFMFFNAVPPGLGFSLGEEIKKPYILDWDRTHPVLRYVDFSNVTVAQSRKLTVPEGAKVICESRHGPLIAVYDQEPAHCVVTAFDTYSSDWPLRLSFPLFLANSLGWLSWRAGEGEGAQLRAGDVIRLPRSAPDTKATIKCPDGAEREVEVSAERAAFFGATERTGLYFLTRTAGDGSAVATQSYAANLTNAAESAIQPAENLRVGYDTIGGKRTVALTDKELWRYIALGAFLLLLLEWYVYNRRVIM